jgi:hypothetical protein
MEIREILLNSEVYVVKYNRYIWFSEEHGWEGRSHARRMKDNKLLSFADEETAINWLLNARNWLLNARAGLIG